MEHYLVSLPLALRSYPTHTQKASVLRQIVGELPIAGDAAGLPDELKALAQSPPPVTSWIPEVHATALYLALRDLYFDDDAGFVDYSYRRNRALLESPLYWILFKLVSARALLRQAPGRWAQLHKGVELGVKLDPKEESVEIRLNNPPYLVPDLLGRCYATAFTAAIELAGAKDAGFELVESSPSGSLFRGKWR